MTQPTPIKRSPQLAALSREHHDGLLFVWKIRQGLKNEASLTTLRKYTMWYWQHHIKQHFYQEEKILLPYFPAVHPLAIQMKSEHESIRELILSADRDPEKELFSNLCNLLENHIRFEERQFFAYLEEHLSTDQLNTILNELEEHPVVCENWNDPFWEKS